MASAAPVQELPPIDLGRLAEWMADAGLPRGPIEEPRSISGGSQNILLRFRMGGGDYVLRRPPLHLRPESNDAMRREVRILTALAQTDVPHPRLIAACDDETVLGTVFYLMAPVDGFCATAAPLPPPHADDRAMRYDMGMALVDGAAALARVDYRAVGLEGFGKPEAYLERQVARWRGQLADYARFAGWSGPQGLPGVEEVAGWLEANRPPAAPAGIIDGDYSMGNVMFRRDGPGLAAIVDWELATIGDPMIDLGWILATWRDPGGVDIGVLRVEPGDGLPTPGQLIARYAERSGRDMSRIDWYVALACFKLAILLEGSFARACAGLSSKATGERLHGAAQRLLQRALHRISDN